MTTLVHGICFTTNDSCNILIVLLRQINLKSVILQKFCNKQIRTSSHIFCFYFISLMGFLFKRMIECIWKNSSLPPLLETPYDAEQWSSKLLITYFCCCSLASITILLQVKTIGSHAFFANCETLANVTIPASTKIDLFALSRL